jgi:hypothetical protein
VPGDGPIGRLGGPLADHDLGGDEVLAAAAAAHAGAGHAQRPAGAQARSAHVAALSTQHKQRLVDRLVEDAHRFIIGEVQTQSVGDLLRAP